MICHNKRLRIGLDKAFPSDVNVRKLRKMTVKMPVKRLQSLKSFERDTALIKMKIFSINLFFKSLMYSGANAALVKDLANAVT